MSKTDATSITRRTFFAATAIGAAGAAAGSSGALAQERKTFVLVHGGWHGGWCWRRVADRLERAGHKVYTPTLTGLADRSHLLSKDIVLDTHIADIANLFKWEDLTNTCLVVHSFGGWTGSGALELIGDRVSSIVWVDAFKPENGQRGIDYSSEFSRKALVESAARGEPGRPAPKASVFFVNEKDQAWVDSKVTDQPNGVALQPIRLTGAREKVAKKTYVRALRYPQAAFDTAYEACTKDPTWRAFKIDAGHDVMIDAPDELTKVILENS